MTIVELQNSIIKKILDISDDQFLDYLNNLLSKDADQAIYNLTDFEKQMLNDSLADYHKGNTHTNDEVFAKTKKWLKE
jgi:hypothetical protein